MHIRRYHFTSDALPVCAVSVSNFARDCVVAVGKAHKRSASSLSSLHKFALGAVRMLISLNIDRSRYRRVNLQLLPFLLFLSFRQSVL